MKNPASVILLLIALTLAFLLHKQAYGQTAARTGAITGFVSDSVSGKKLEFMTVSLLTAQNEIVKTGYSQADGSFLFPDLLPAAYKVVIDGVGYRRRTLMADLSGASGKVLELGEIKISPGTIALEEVSVTAAKQIIRQEIDRISYDLQADPESKVFNVLEIIRKVPHLSLDADNNLYLKGNTDFRILINGRPSSMAERNYKDLLRSMPASSIERIEVITNPPAKYDAEGLAGIINIITSKRIDNGFGGSANVSTRFPVGGPGAGGSVSAKLGKWGMTGMAGGNIYNTPETYNSTGRVTLGSSPTNLLQTGTGTSDNKSGYIGYEVSYEIDSLNLISGQVNLNGNRSAGSAQQMSVLSSPQDIVQQYQLTNRNAGTGNGMDAALNYQKGFRADKNRLLTFSYRFFRFGNHQHTDLGLTQRINYQRPDYSQVNDQRFAEQTFQVDYVTSYRKLNIEAGLKVIMRNNESDFQYNIRNSETGGFEADPSQRNHFANTQNVYGAYNTYQYKFGSWGIKAGVRLEKTGMHADFISSVTTVEQNYFNIIPSLSVQKKLKKHNSGLTLGYSQRIQRPGIYQLNPFIDRSNPNFERTGNPNLRPATVNDFQLGYNRAKKGSVNFSVGAILFTDLIFPVSVYDSVTNINRISYGNTGKARLLTAQLSWNYPISKRWDLNLNARTAHGKVTGVVNGAVITNRGLMTNANLSTSYRLKKDWRAQANLNFNGPGVNLQGTSNSVLFSSFSISKDVVKDKLSLSAAVNNPFSQFRRNYRYTFGPDFDQTDFRREYFRTFNVSANYKFGSLKDTIRKNKRGIRNDDVQN